MGMWIEFWTWQIGAGGGWGPEVGIHSYHILSRILSTTQRFPFRYEELPWE